MSDEGLFLSDDNIKPETDTKMSQGEFIETIKNTTKGIDGIKEKLSEDEKIKIEENKEKRKSKSPTVLIEEIKTVEDELNYQRDDLNEDELKFSQDLNDELAEFITDKAGLSPGTGTKFLLPTGIDLLDAVAGGGFAAGALTLIAGNPGTFKSALIAQTIATNQKKYRGATQNIYLDSEEAMTSQRLKDLGVQGHLPPIPSVTVESVFKAIEALAMFKDKHDKVDTPSILCWDSIANTITDKEKAASEMDPSKYIGLKARIISQLLPKYITKLREYNIGFLVVNQLREKIDMGFFPTANDLRWLGDKTMPGGQALKYNAFHLLFLKIKTDLKQEQWGFRGVMLEAKFAKNKLFQPNIPVELIVDFSTGVSNFWTNFHMLVKNNRLTGTSWRKLEAMPEIKFRTSDALNKYNENEEFKKMWDQQVTDCINTNYIDPHRPKE